MRLKCTLRRPALLCSVCHSLEKGSVGSKPAHKCVLRFTPTKLHICNAMESGQQYSLAAFAHLANEALFDGYEVESLMENMISLEISSIEFLCRSLRGIEQAVIRLGKVPGTQQPLLVIRSLTRNKFTGGEVTLKHDIPCKVLTAAAAAAIKEPVMGRIGAHIMLPELHRLRLAVDRMKTLGNYLKVSANMRGQFRLHVQSDTVEVTTGFADLEHPELDPDQVGATQVESLIDDPATFTETVIDIRNMSRFMYCAQVNPSEVICCLYGEYGLVFHAYIGQPEDDCVLTYFIAGCVDD